MSSTRSAEQNVTHGVPPQYIRPTLRITAPCWINDPCSACYDPTTQTYHLFYESNGTGATEWGNMSWGHVTSKDLLTWKRQPPQPVLKPDQKYDQAGVFTGCVIPPTMQDGGKLTAFYSSITKLPFHWTKPYPRNVAGISAATSVDGGQTWTKSPNNPILQGEPEDLVVTGFRDPYVSEWPELDAVRGKKQTCLYGLVAGGIKDVGPTLFFYEIDSMNHESWNYLGTLIDVPERHQVGSKWGADFCMNFECTNFMTLRSEALARHFLIIGTEGDVQRECINHLLVVSNIAPRGMSYQLWASGDLTCVNDVPKFVPRIVGMLDYGSYYAANSFFDTATNRRIVYGWIPEEDAPASYHAAKGWNGAMALPREVFLLTLRKVTRALRSPLANMVCFEQHEEADGTTTMHTLGIRPIAELAEFRRNASRHQRFPRMSLSQVGGPKRLATTTSPNWELSATITVSQKCKAVIFYIRSNPKLPVQSTVAFHSERETISVGRIQSTPHVTIDSNTEAGPFTLFSLRDPVTGEEKQEDLRLRIISDGDFLEVFANDRFALATKIYSGDPVEHGGILILAQGGADCAVLEDGELWEGLNGGQNIVEEVEE